MIIVTGRSVPHMRKMADTVVAAVCIVVLVGLLVWGCSCLRPPLPSCLPQQRACWLLPRRSLCLLEQLRSRKLRPSGNFPQVEGRECDDWMVVDGGNVIVNVFDEGTAQPAPCPPPSVALTSLLGTGAVILCLRSAGML